MEPVKDESPSTKPPRSSITLTISQEDAQRMMAASKALNESVAQHRENVELKEISPTNKDNADVVPTEDTQIPKRVVSVSDCGSVSSSDETRVAGSKSMPVTEVLLAAAADCKDELICAFLKRLKESNFSEHETKTCLLLFLEMDKSNKLLTAFTVLSKEEKDDEPSTVSESKQDETDESKDKDASNEESKDVKMEETDVSDQSESEEKNKIAKPSTSLTSESATLLFKSFLTAISFCIKRDANMSKTIQPSSPKDEVEKPRKALKESEHSSPTSTNMATDEAEAKIGQDGDSTPSKSSNDSSDDLNRFPLSPKTSKEVLDIATFAAERLLEHIKRKGKDGTRVPFEDFGEWYNSGGFSIVPWLELLDLTKWKYSGQKNTKETESRSTKKVDGPSSSKNPGASPPNFFKSAVSDKFSSHSRGSVLVSFDFTGAVTSNGKREPFTISITDENLVMLRNLVYRTGLITRSPEDVCAILLRHSTERILESGSVMVLHREFFGRCIRELVPPEASRQFSRVEMETFSTHFTNFFSCFENGELGSDEVNVKELAVGFSFLCSGNKSAKLAAGFDLLNNNKSGKLTTRELAQFLRSYLTMLGGISLLSGSPAGMAEVKQLLQGPRRNAMFSALDNGSKWTLGHFVKEFGKGTGKEEITASFEDFAKWYTEGGFNIAPWLELLDLNKLLMLLGTRPPHPHERPSALRNGVHNSMRKQPPGSRSPRSRRPQDYAPIPPAEILFTFPLANQQSLVVLREDATYVRSVVDKLGLASMSAEEVWSSLYQCVKFHPPPQAWNRNKNGVGKTMDVDQRGFVNGMEEVIVSKSSGRKRQATGSSIVSSNTKETLVNFFHSFDLEQIDRVPLNQLMGGLSLLCGGKKSTKLAFSFGLFDSRNDDENGKRSPGDHPNSLNGEELFFFLRSFLIVMFSCCRQSLALSADAVGRYIAETSHMVTEDVMKYQWKQSKKDRVDFDEFGRWYNEGGFETAPWLELLDLHKWVLADTVPKSENGSSASAAFQAPSAHVSPRGPNPSPPHDYGDCPPPPPEDAVDPSFFGDDDNAIMPLGSMDEMDYILMQQPSQDKENDLAGGNRFPYALSPQQRDSRHRPPNTNALKFHLVTNEDHGGYMLSISQARVRHLRHVLLESELCKIDAELACQKILSKAAVVRSNGRSVKKKKGDGNMLALNKDDFDSAIRSIISGGPTKPNMSPDTQRTLSDMLGGIFNAFDRSQNGLPSAVEVACGFMVLCNGKKSDKLEYGFELLDKDKDGKLSRRDMANYLRSFLTALLSISSTPCLDFDDNEDIMSYLNGNRCERGSSVNSRAVDAGSSWAASQAFKCFKGKTSNESITFDDFAEWYTNVGYSSIPWLELLDLRKWVLVDGY